jgi:hypothetical protein
VRLPALERFRAKSVGPFSYYFPRLLISGCGRNTLRATYQGFIRAESVAGFLNFVERGAEGESATSQKVRAKFPAAVLDIRAVDASLVVCCCYCCSCCCCCRCCKLRRNANIDFAPLINIFMAPVSLFFFSTLI